MSGLGHLLVLLLARTPEPQLTEQELHSSQEDHCPATKKHDIRMTGLLVLLGLGDGNYFSLPQLFPSSMVTEIKFGSSGPSNVIWNWRLSSCPYLSPLNHDFGVTENILPLVGVASAFQN